MDLFISILRGLFGLVVLLACCYFFSNNKKAIDWKLVGVGVVLQLIFALAVIKIDFVHNFFNYLSKLFVKLISVSYSGFNGIDGGGKFLLGKFSEVNATWGYVFAMQVLPIIIFFSALSSMLYYLGVLQKVVYGFAWVLSKTMKQVTGSESVSTAANIFLGQTEAPLMVRPYLAGMNQSEILCVMIGGMANTAGSVLAAYIGMICAADAACGSKYALHMLTQSIMSAPAAIVVAKMLFPQTDNNINRNLEISKDQVGTNLLDAIANGTTDGLKLAVNVAAMLIAFIGIITVLNYILFAIGHHTGLNIAIQNFTGNPNTFLSFQTIAGFVFAPLAWVIGIDWADAFSAGQLLGVKTMVNEFVAYADFAQMKAAGVIKSEKTLIIMTYALCGFANFSSIGIQIGGIGALAPNQRENLSQLGIKALIGGTIVCLMNATIAGMLL